MAYFDAYVVPVPKDKLDEYKAFAQSVIHFWTEEGCLSYVECVGDGLRPGETTSFPRAVQAKDDEVVVLGWAVWPDKATRDAAGAKMKAATPPSSPLPFDGQRMFWGGFAPLIEWSEGA